LRIRPGSYQLSFSGASIAQQQMPVVVADKDVTGLEVQVQPTVILTGTVNVEGNGLRPRLSIIFSPFRGSNNNIQTASPLTNSNGTFRVVLPEGDYRIGWSNLPAGYELKSIAAGSTDLLSAPLKVSSNPPPPPIVVNLGVGEKAPWVKVSGKVTGLPAVQNGTPYRLALSGSTLIDLPEVPVNPDGSFEFTRLLPGTYLPRFTPALPVPATSFNVANRDVTDVAIVIPPLKEIRGVLNVNVSGILRLGWSESSGANTAATGSSIDGKFTFLVPEGERRVTLNVPGFTVQSFTYGSVDLLKEPLKVSSADVAEFRATLTPGGPPTTGAVGGVLGSIIMPPPPPPTVGVVGGVLGGIVGGVPGGTFAPSPPPTPPPAIATGAITRIGGDVAQANLISSVQPVYPEIAKAARVQGVVLLNAQISKEGVVEDLRVISGHALLNDAAIQAVRQWRYRPQMLSGQPIPVVTTITVNFVMQ
jgi:TonB family protein